MSKGPDRRPTRSPAFVAPAQPPETPAEAETNQRLVAMLEEASAGLRQRNLNNAVLLAQQAAAGRGPLVEHFMELGRRYAHLLSTPQKPCLKVIDGGAT